ncbi:MAG: EAL domain-containing protein [Rhodocyclaceae bacterium]|nr:EAL domain-containing protein [Rhodocyclaceae bacterium]
MAAVLAIGAMIATAIAVALYTAGFDRSARTRSTAAEQYFREKVHHIENGWEERLMREKSRIEFSRMLEDRTLRWERLRAYLASMSASALYSGLAISDAGGREIFHNGQGFSRRWPALEANVPDQHFYGTDASGTLFLALSQPIWLGADGMGVMHAMIPLDNGFLRSNAFPDTELFVEWQERIVAGSGGTNSLAHGVPGFTGRIDRDGARFEQSRIDLPLEAAETPMLLIQTRVSPPFSASESIALGATVFGVLAILIASLLHGWIRRLLRRIESIGVATRLYASDGKPSPAIDEALTRAAGNENDEFSVVAQSMHGMIATLKIREHERQAALAQLQQSERRFRDVAESAGEFIWEIDARQTYVYLSERAAEVFGLPLEKLIGSSVFDYVPPDEHEVLRLRIGELGRNGRPFRKFELHICRPDGECRWVAYSGTPLLTADGRLTGTYRGTAEDVTQRKRSEESLLLADKVFANSDQAILITGPDANIISVNPAFTTITGYTAAEAVGKNPRLFSSGRHDAAFYAAMWGELRRSGAWAGEVWDRRKSGEIYPKWLSINAVQDPASGDTTHYVAIFSDITDRKENEARIEHLAYHDHLTGLPNRFALLARLTQSLADARRNGQQLALMFIDLDHFKTINDSLGHDVGDQLLVAVARRIRAALRETDTVARLGGDEFVIVVPGLAGPEDAAHVAEKVIAFINDPLALAGHTLHTSPSIGIGIFPTDGTDADTLMKNADTAMYHAKQHGRNAYHFFAADMNTAATERLMMETQLRAALDRNEMRLVYQPQVDLASGEVVGVEALVRWHHPERGLVSPLQFIPVAEETGLIVPLGAWILDEACRQAVAWTKAGLPPVRIAVNLSAHQFRDRNLAHQVAATLARTGLAANRLELEITESAVMENAAQAIETLRALRDQGIQLAIDDFGTGYSSLAYLKRFPLSRLKIDRSFVMDLEQDANDVAIVRSIVALAHTLGLAVIAEGIETAAQLAMLKDFACAEGQGYLFSRPLAPDDLAAFLRPALPPPVGEPAPPLRLH